MDKTELLNLIDNVKNIVESTTEETTLDDVLDYTQNASNNELVRIIDSLEGSMAFDTRVQQIISDDPSLVNKDDITIDDLDDDIKSECYNEILKDKVKNGRIAEILTEIIDYN